MNKQLEGLWVSYRYSNNNSKDKAITDAIRLAKDGRYDLYCAQNIVPILINEGYTTEALLALSTVLNVWPLNDWAISVKYKLITGVYRNFDQDIELENDNEDEIQ